MDDKAYVNAVNRMRELLNEMHDQP
jgi:hypothetical protein